MGKIKVNKGNILSQYSLFQNKNKKCQVFEEKLNFFLVFQVLWNSLVITDEIKLKLYYGKFH